MSLSKPSVEALMRTGVNVTVNAKNYNPDTLMGFVKIAMAMGTHLTIKEGGAAYSPATLENIGKAGKKNVTIEV